MLKLTIYELEKKYDKLDNKIIEIDGWIKFIRFSKQIIFLIIKDGTTLKSCQIIIKNNLINFEELKKITINSAIKIIGNVTLTPNSKQEYEIVASQAQIINRSDEKYPLQNKEHSNEFLREIAHLRAKSSTYYSVFKIKSLSAKFIHDFFEKEHFLWMQTPIITSNDTEGSGESFIVTTRNDGNYNDDFFKQKALLTVSGQLNAEALAQAFNRIYTFGPTFRAENSNTSRHAAEFWMIEPEVAFATYYDMMDNAQKLIKYLFKRILEECLDEINYLAKKFNLDLISRYKKIIDEKFLVIEYQEVLNRLKEAKLKGHQFENDSNFEFGLDLATEHEKYLTVNIYKKPIFVINYPKSIKAFYMYQNDDNKTVRAFDLLIDEIGEIVGGSERESRYDVLIQATKDKKIEIKDLEWYFDLRKFGYSGSAGYGIGFERLLMLLTGVQNIRDVLLFPRTSGQLNF